MKNNFSCIIVDDEPKAIELLKECLSYLFPDLIVLDSFTSWSTALPVLRTTKCDILFLDISMPGKSGLDLLTLLPELETEIIFITAHSEHALSAFKFAPSGYILKPIDDIQLTVAVKKSIERSQFKEVAKNTVTAASSQKIGVPNNKGTDYLNIDEIIYLESLNGCTKVATVYGNITSSYNLGRFKTVVEKYNFFQVHRSYIINLNHIKRYTTDGDIQLSNGEEIPISRNVRDEFLLKFNKVSKNDF